MSWTERVQIYRDIEKLRKRPLIAYVTSKRNGASARMSSDAMPWIIEQIDALPDNTKELDFLIASYGGDPMVAWRIMTLIRQRVDKVAVIIPQSAYSAATLVALGADEIIMHPNGHLGPVDMQIYTPGDSGQGGRTFSTEDISSFLDFVRDNLKITDQKHICTLFDAVCEEIGALTIGFTARSSQLAIDLGERLLRFHMKDDEAGSKLRNIVETMSRKFKFHGYPVNRKEASEIGLPVSKESDKKLDKLVWDVWLDIERELKENVPFDPLMKVVSHPTEGPKLLSPVPQLDIPLCATAGSHYQTQMGDITNNAAIVKVEPVDFEHTVVIIESGRMAFAEVVKGKILSCRMPDLMIKCNRVLTSVEWNRTQ